MVAKRLGSTLRVLAVCILWIFRDAVAQDICPSSGSSCKGSVTVPCSGSSDCSAVNTTGTGSGVPGGDSQCSDGTTAAYWKAPIPTTWQGCVTGKSGTGSGDPGVCTKKAATCTTLTLYKSKADCTAGTNACLTDNQEQCKADTAPCTR